MANFELNLWQDRNLISEMEIMNRQFPNLLPGFIIRLRVHHRNNNPLQRAPQSKPDVFSHKLDAVFLSYQGMLDFLSNILAGEGIPVENDGRFLIPSRFQILQASASRRQPEPIYTLMQLAECVLNYAWLMRNNIYRFVKFTPIAMDLTVTYMPFQFDPVDGTLILYSYDSLPVIESNTTAPAVRLVEGIFQGSCTEDCSICLERFAVRQMTCRTPCAHIFHKNCIAPWVKKSRSCPMCRADLSV